MEHPQPTDAPLATPDHVTIVPFVPYEIPGKPWGTELVIADTPHYTGKILTMHAGHRGGLQYHEQKDESFYLQSGSAIVLFDSGFGHLFRRLMRPGECIHVPPGAVHQVLAVTDCVLIEVSTPVFDDRVNVSDKFQAGDSGVSQ